MDYPENTSHFQSWYFKNEEELEDMYYNQYNSFKEKYKQFNLVIPEYKELEKTKLYFCYQLTHFCQMKMLNTQVIECAILLYNRFYLRESILIYDPRILIFTCIILAIKLEGCGRLYKMKYFFEDININIDKVLSHEHIVCSALNFELNFLYTKESIYYLKYKFVSYMKKYINIENEITDSFENICNKIYINTTGDCLKIMENFYITFTFTPSQIALYSFLSNVKIYCNIVNTDKFVLEFLTNNNQILFQKLKNKMDSLHKKYKTHIEMRNSFDDENTTKQIGETLDMCIDIYSFFKKMNKKSKKKKVETEQNKQNTSSPKSSSEQPADINN